MLVTALGSVLGKPVLCGHPMRDGCDMDRIEENDRRKRGGQASKEIVEKAEVLLKKPCRECPLNVH